MRVLCVGNLYPPHALGGGYELTFQSSVADLRRRGHEVVVVTTDHVEPNAPPDEDEDVHRALRWYWRGHAFPRRGWRARLAIERHNAEVLDWFLREQAPDAVCWWGMGGMSLGLLEHVRRAGIPAVGVVGDEWMVWGPRMDAWTRPFRGRPRLARLAERVTGLPARPDIGGAATWLFNSEHVRRASLAAQPELPRTAVAYPGIDDSLFRAAPGRDWGWRLLYLGRLDPRKGVDTAVRALALLPPEALLVLQGSGDPAYVRELRELAAALGVEERVLLSRRPRDELPEVYASADAVLFPVRWDEPWGLVPLEAMAVGRPVVATGTGGSGEYLRHEENCLLYAPPDSAEELAEAVERLAAEPELRARLRERGFETASRFTERGYNDAIARALEDAAGRQRGSG